MTGAVPMPALPLGAGRGVGGSPFPLSGGRP